MNNSQPVFSPGPTDEKSETDRYIGSIAWAVFFIWVGIALLANLPWVWFFIGVGILVLVAQFARWQMNLEVERFWVACGVVFLVGGVWTLLELPWPLAPILVILLGVWLLGKTFVDARR